MHFDPTFGAAHPLAGDAPQQTLALVAVCGRGGRPDLKIVRCGARDGVDESLQRLLVHVSLLLVQRKTKHNDDEEAGHDTMRVEKLPEEKHTTTEGREG